MRVTASRERLVWALALAMLAIDVAGMAWIWNLDATATEHVSRPVQFLLSTGAFVAGERLVVTIRIREDGISSSLVELPIAIGLIMVAPLAFIAGRLVGTFLALLPTYRRERNALKLAYNTGLLTLSALITLGLFRLMTPDVPGDDLWVVWASMLVAILVGHLWGVMMIALVVKLTNPSAPWRNLLRVGLFGSANTLTLSVEGVVLAVATYADPWMILIDAVAFVGTYLLLRIYGSLGMQYETLQRLYDYSRELTGSHSVRAGVQASLTHGGDLLGSSRGMLFVPWADERHYWVMRDGRVDHLPIEQPTAKAVEALLDGGETAIVDVERDQRPGARVLRDAGFRAVTIGALTGHGGTGWLLFASDPTKPVLRRTRSLMANVAAQCATALGRTELVDRLKAEASERERRALHDRLTGLPNRDYFTQRLDQVMESRVREEEVAVLIVDLDHFKEVNDSLGHHHGDQLLREVGSRLRNHLRSSEFLARLGGDEFGVLLHSPGAGAEATALAERIAELLEEPIDIDDTRIAVGGSIGIAVCPRHSEDPAKLISGADVAMYAAKRDDLQFVMYERETEQDWRRRIEVLGRLRGVDLDTIIDVQFQPQADLKTGEPVALEALARWFDDKLGHVSPAEFIPVAEQSGLIRPLTLVVLRKAVTALRACHDAGHRVTLAVNLSARALLDLEIVNCVAEALEEEGLSPADLTIEVTESVFVSDSQRLNEVLLAYEDMGVRLSIDDFGTGYSSLGYLRRLPAHELKIDRSFVDGMVNDASKLAIVKSTVALAHELGLDAVAEGIEDVQTMAMLRQIGCDVGQGYLLGRPMPLEDVLAWLDVPNIPRTAELDRVQQLLPTPLLRPASLRRV